MNSLANCRVPTELLGSVTRKYLSLRWPAAVKDDLTHRLVFALMSSFPQCARKALYVLVLTTGIFKSTKWLIDEFLNTLRINLEYDIIILESRHGLLTTHSKSEHVASVVDSVMVAERFRNGANLSINVATKNSRADIAITIALLCVSNNVDCNRGNIPPWPRQMKLRVLRGCLCITC